MSALVPMFSSTGNDGDMIAITQTSTEGNELHASIAGTDHIEEVFVYACNIHTANVLVTIEIGGVAAANRMTHSIPFDDGFHLIVPGIRIQNGTTIDAFASVTAVINCFVSVNRYIDPEEAS